MRFVSILVVYQRCVKALHITAAAIAIAFFAQNAFADDVPEGMMGWWYHITWTKSGYAPDPVTACKLTAKNHHNKELLDIRRGGNNGTNFECNYLHPFDAVNKLKGPQWYGKTDLRCNVGYLPRSPGVCVKKDEPPIPPSCNPGSPGYALGNPVTVSTGAKVQSEIDFRGTPAGALKITRSYRAFAPYTYGQSAGINWSFSFDRVFLIQNRSADDRPLTIIGSSGDGYFRFTWNPTKAIYESDLDKAASLAPLNANYDEWLMVRNGRAETFKKHVTMQGRIIRYLLVSSQGMDGEIEHYSYDPESLNLKAIADRHGRVLEIGWGSYAITSISGPEGRINYSYDWWEFNRDQEIPFTRRLKAVEFFDTAGISIGRREYHYETRFNYYFLTGITDENGNRFAAYVYDSAGRTISSEHSGGSNRFTFAYPNNTTRVIVDPAGAQRTIGLRSIGGTGVSTGETQPAGSGCNAAVSAITHDSAGNIGSRTDFNGIKTCFVHDARGRETRRVSGLQGGYFCPASDDAILDLNNIRQVRTKWHPTFALIAAVAEPNRITSYLYNGQRDAQGVLVECGAGATLAPGIPLPRLCKKTVQPTTDPDGKAGFSARSAGTARFWEYTYGIDGEVLTQTGPSDGRGHAKKETRVYYEDTGATHTEGDLASVTNETGETTHFLEYSPYGLPTKVRLPNQLTATLRYGPRQHLSSLDLEDRSGIIERSNYEYDSVGNLIRIVASDGSAINYGYDEAHRLTHLSDDAGNRIQLRLDSAGNVVRQEIYGKGGELSQRVTRSYDVLNRLQREQTALDENGTRFEYDANGNLTKVIDELGRATALEYDTFNRVVRETKSSSATAITQSINYTYSHRDELLSVADPRGLMTRYTVDGFGDVIKVMSPDSGITTRTYDAAGNVKTIRDARGSAMQHEYDLAGRITRYGNSRYEYGAPGGTAPGKLIKMIDDSGQTKFDFDGFGRLLSASQLVAIGPRSQPFNLTYAYGTTGTSTGHVRSITYPSGNRVEFNYGSDGRPASLFLSAPDRSAPVTLIGNILYGPLGEVLGWAWGNSTASKLNTYERQFDLDGKIVGFPLGHPEKNGVMRTIEYDAVNRIVHAQHAGTTTNSALDQRYFYDDLDRLTAFDSNNVSHSFTYDKNSNRVTARFGETTYKYTTSPASNRLNSTTGPTPAKVNTYDAVGNLTSDGTVHYSYSVSGRLESAVAGNITTGYHYNGLGQRVAKTRQGRVTTYYVYNEQGRLVGEYDGAGRPTQETIYLGDVPIAVVKSAQGSRPPSIYYIYTDHLSTPRVITRASDNTMVWRWDQSDPHGLFQPEENPSGAGTFTYNPRFPGQIFDKETNNHYNYFRDYDPQTGRYIQSDPTGLAGGLNTYLYANANPLHFTDPYGLCPCGNPAELLSRARSDKRNWSKAADRSDINSGFGPDTYKCNIFADTQYEGAGYNLPNIGGSILAQLIGKNPPGAGELSKPDYKVRGWPTVKGPAQPGDLVATGGHVGIAASATTTISASPSGVVENSWGFRFGQQSVIRRCSCN